MTIILMNVYCTKKLATGEVRKFGPYGPYYYEFWRDPESGLTRSKYRGIYTPEEVLDLSWNL